MAMLVGLVVVAVCFTPASGIHCEEDKKLSGAASKEYTQEVPDMGDMDYWRTSQNNFQVFGTWDGDTSKSVIWAAYYNEDDALIHGIEIDCKKRKWTSYVTNKDDKVEKWLTGDLAKDCVDGEPFDIWFKIHQPFLMSWIWNGQPLQYDTQETKFRHGSHIVYRTRTLHTPTKYGSNQGRYFKVKSTGAGQFTRLTWGQCIAWPLSMQENCLAAREWVQRRSKMDQAAQPFGGLGHFGSDWQIFAPQCFLGSRYYDFLQSTVHPDRNSKGYPYCCCVDMVTGLAVGTEEDCQLGKEDGGCDRSCMTSANNDIIEEVMLEQESLLRS